MQSELKHYRIISENGEALLLTQERFHNILATLDLLATEAPARPEQKPLQKQS